MCILTSSWLERVVPSLRPAVRDPVSGESGESAESSQIVHSPIRIGVTKITFWRPESGSFVGENDSRVEFWDPNLYMQTPDPPPQRPLLVCRTRVAGSLDRGSLGWDQNRAFRSGSRRQKSSVLGPESGSFIGENDSNVEFWGPESGT